MSGFKRVAAFSIILGMFLAGLGIRYRLQSTIVPRALESAPTIDTVEQVGSGFVRAYGRSALHGCRSPFCLTFPAPRPT